MKDILKAASQTGGAAVVVLVLTVITTKVLAVVLGADGLGLYSILMQAQLTVVGLATFGGGLALVQGVSSKEGQDRDKYITTVFWLFVAGGVTASALLLGAAPWIAALLTGRSDEQSIALIRWLTIPVVLGIAQSFLGSILNGFRAIGRLALSKVAGTLLLALLAYPLSRLVEAGYLIVLVGLLSSSFVVQVALNLHTALHDGLLTPLARRVNHVPAGATIKHFFAIAGAMLVSSQLGSYVMLAVNSSIAQSWDLARVGVFSAAWNLSTNYVLLLLTSFTTYYLPTLSRATDAPQRALLMENIARLTTMLSVPLVVSVIALKSLIIATLYSSQFSPALEIVRWMLIGDYLKIASYVMAMPALAYADMRTFLWTESAWFLGFFGISALSINVYGSIEGIGLAFTLLYALYLLYFVFYTRKRHEFTVSAHTGSMWLLGLGIILAASAYTWDHKTVDWIAAFLWIALAVLFSCFMPKMGERRRALEMFRIGFGKMRLRWTARGR